MSGILYIMPTEFYDLTTKTKTLGVRIFNDDIHAYENRWTDLPEDDVKLLERLLSSDDEQILEMFDDMIDNKSNVIISGKLYKFDIIEKIIKDLYELQ